MSIKLMHEVWERDFSGLDQAIALVLTDHANDEGSGIEVSVGKIAWLVGASRRTVQRHLKAFRLSGVISFNGHGQKGVSRYDLDLKAQPLKRAWTPTRAQVPTLLLPAVLRQSANTCALCHRSGGEFDPDGAEWVLKRIIPTRLGGRWTFENCAPLCAVCSNVIRDYESHFLWSHRVVLPDHVDRAIAPANGPEDLTTEQQRFEAFLRRCVTNDSAWSAYALAAFAAYHYSFKEAKMLISEVALKSKGSLHKSYFLALSTGRPSELYLKSIATA